ncbi:MAG: inorganic phosphate transporter, partial [Spirochaetota bacterium]
PMKTRTWLLLIAGIIMVITLWLSRKARTVTETEVSLGRQDEGYERFGSTPLSRATVRMFSFIFGGINILIPEKISSAIAGRFNSVDTQLTQADKKPQFDLLRASVNLMVASAVVSFATSMKLPLSTTYVTFMVAMGTSLSDKAWGRESAVYRVAGVFAVIGGWFFTAFSAFTVSLIFAFIIYYFKAPGLVAIIGLTLYLIWRNHHLHKSRHNEKEEIDVFNLKKVTDSEYAIQNTFEHTSILLREVNKSIHKCIHALVSENRFQLKDSRRDTRKIQLWANIIIANIFKTLRILQKDELHLTREYSKTISALQEIAESHRDIVMRSYLHISNHHKGLLDVQVHEIREVENILSGMLNSISDILLQEHSMETTTLQDDLDTLKSKIQQFDRNQIERIQDETSKTRLSILFYGILGNMQKIAEQTASLLKIFHDSFEKR